MHQQLHRRGFLIGTSALGASVLLPTASWGRRPPTPASDKKVAAIVTTYHRYSHADNIVTRFIEGYSIIGRSYPPPCQVASLFIDQVNDADIGRPLAHHWEVPVHRNIRDALTLGTGKLAVDGVLIVAEQGDYPLNKLGQKLYPRRQFFEQVVRVFRESKQSVPVFIDKHLSYSWDDARWMYEQSRELGFPMMAGSSIPVTHRRPDLRPAVGIEWERALSVGYGHFEVYGFHTLEGLQVMAERRRGGETGVRSVQCLEGKAAWEAARANRWDRQLLDAALSRMPRRGKRTVQEDDADALVYLVDYTDGLRAASYMSPRHVAEFGFAGKVRGEAEPQSCWYELPKPQRDHFSFLTHNVAQMMMTGKPAYPVERTLLTTGVLAALMESKGNDGRRVDTPHLGIKYQV